MIKKQNILIMRFFYERNYLTKKSLKNEIFFIIIMVLEWI